MANAKKSTDVAGTEPAGQASADAGAHSAHDASRRPIRTWTVNRVECSIWKHEYHDQARYTVSICRSYFDRKSNQVKRNFYFDEQDLRDVVEVANEARDRILGLNGMTQSAGED